LKVITICYFGEGAASEGDFHAALNFASTLNAPVIFFCRNNRYAISTPSEEQYRGDGIASRGVGYGMDSVRVDGNDLFAVYNVTNAARNYCLDNNRPVLIEAMTYRVGHHSTSDDATRYRTAEEVEEWKQKYNPITRLKNYMKNNNIWDDDKDAALWKESRKDILDALKRSETHKKPPISALFTDVYDQLTPNLIEQKQELEEHLKKYGEHYPLDQHSPEKQETFSD